MWVLLSFDGTLAILASTLVGSHSTTMLAYSIGRIMFLECAGGTDPQ